MATISSTWGGLVHRLMAVNSEPPPKLTPVMSGTVSTLRPFWVAWAPSTSANGIKPISTGSASRSPRRASRRRAEAAAEDGRAREEELERLRELPDMTGHKQMNWSNSFCAKDAEIWFLYRLKKRTLRHKMPRLWIKRNFVPMELDALDLRILRA